MSTKHTPGPWFCGRALRGGQECIVGDGDSVVAFMPDRTIGCTFIPEDARLIAAAPDGLALARYAVDNPDFDSAIFDRMARKFIAKATGEKA